MKGRAVMMRTMIQVLVGGLAAAADSEQLAHGSRGRRAMIANATAVDTAIFRGAGTQVQRTSLAEYIKANDCPTPKPRQPIPRSSFFVKDEARLVCAQATDHGSRRDKPASAGLKAASGVFAKDSRHRYSTYIELRFHRSRRPAFEGVWAATERPICILLSSFNLTVIEHPHDPCMDNGTGITVIDVGGPFASNYYHSTVQYIVASVVANETFPTAVVTAHWRTLSVGKAMYGHLFPETLPNGMPRWQPNRAALYQTKCVKATVRASFNGCGTDGVGLDAVASRLTTLGEQCSNQHGTARKVLVLREDGTTRPMLNRAKLKQAMAEIGFAAITLKGMSVAQQSCVFGGADVVVGEHGAGLANALFMHPGAGLVELTPAPWWVHSSFMQLAAYRGVHFARYIGDEGDRKKSDISHKGYHCHVTQVVDFVRQLEASWRFKPDQHQLSSATQY